ncbi:MAG: signal peptidase I [Rhodoferax sp.]|nr:signal peptidase I [Rhodoferax sp.]
MRRILRENRGFVAFLLLFGLFRTAVADWNPIPSGSMHPNLLEGDVVFVNRLAYDLKVPLTDIIVLKLGDPQRGDIVTFSSPKDGTRMIKRLMAVPGDHVEMRNKLLYINGVAAQYQDAVPERNHDALDAPWPVRHALETAGGHTHPIQWLGDVVGRDNFQPVTLGSNQYLMLGDNRDNSADSRFIGLVPRERLIGKAVRVMVSADITGNWMPRLERIGQALI